MSLHLSGAPLPCSKAKGLEAAGKVGQWLQPRDGHPGLVIVSDGRGGITIGVASLGPPHDQRGWRDRCDHEGHDRSGRYGRHGQGGRHARC
jgi:hypothetical protein